MDGQDQARRPSACNGRGCSCCRAAPLLRLELSRTQLDLQLARARARLAEVKGERLQAELHVLGRAFEEQPQQGPQQGAAQHTPRQDEGYPLGGAHGMVVISGGPDGGMGCSAALATPNGQVPPSPQHHAAAGVAGGAAAGVHGAHEGQHRQQQQRQSQPQQHHHQQPQLQQQHQPAMPPATGMARSPGNDSRQQHGDFGWRSLRGGPAGLGAGVGTQRPASPAAGPAVAAGTAAASSPLQINAGGGSRTVAAVAAEVAAVPTAALENRTAARHCPRDAAPAAAPQGGRSGPIQTRPPQMHSIKPERSAGSSGQACGVTGGGGGLYAEGPEGSSSFGFRGGVGQGAAAAGGQTHSASDTAGANSDDASVGEPPLVSSGYGAGADGKAAARAGAAGPELVTTAVASDAGQQGSGGPPPQAQADVTGAEAGGAEGGGQWGCWSPAEQAACRRRWRCAQEAVPDGGGGRHRCSSASAAGSRGCGGRRPWPLRRCSGARGTGGRS